MLTMKFLFICFPPRFRRQSVRGFLSEEMLTKENLTSLADFQIDANGKFVGLFLRNTSLEHLPVVPVWPLPPERLGYRYSEIVRPKWWFERIEEEDRTKICNKIRNIVSRDSLGSVEYIFTNSSGEKVLLSEHFLPYGNEAPVTFSCWVVGEGISSGQHDQRAQVDLVAHRRKPSSNLMAAALLHESRQPISTISLAVDNAIRKLENARSGEAISYIGKKLEKIKTSIDRISAISEAVSRLEALRSVEDLQEPVDVDAALMDAAQMLTERYGKDEFNISIEMDLRDGRHYTIGDETLLRHAFLNILNNAADSINAHQINEPADGGKIKVTARSSGGFIHLTIEDNGAGVGPAVAANMFEPFCSSKSDGMGIGLAFVSRVIQVFGGTVGHADTESGNGAVFLLCLPEFVGEAQSSDSAPEQENADAYLSQGKYKFSLYE